MLRTAEEWKSRGYLIRRGERAKYRRMYDAQCVFNDAQIVPIETYRPVVVERRVYPSWNVYDKARYFLA